jgi:hypothetical protein
MTQSAYEQRVIRLLEEQARVLLTIDTVLTDVVDVIKKNSDTVAGAVEDAADRIVAALGATEKEC